MQLWYVVSTGNLIEKCGKKVTEVKTEKCRAIWVIGNRQ